MEVYIAKMATYKRIKGTKLNPVYSDCKMIVGNKETAVDKFMEFESTCHESMILKRCDVAYVDLFIPYQYEDGTLETNLSTLGYTVKTTKLGHD